MTSTADFQSTWNDLAPIGREAKTGGYSRFAWTADDHTLREWFIGEAEGRGLDVQVDRNGNIWAWWGAPGPNAVVTGSHLDSVPGGGAYDGPLGVVSSLLALDDLIARGVQPQRPFAVVVFTEEEGGRFGVPCLGSSLMVGKVTPERALGLTDLDGVSLAEALKASGVRPQDLGPDQENLDRIGAFVELHVEQGQGLVDLGSPVGVASSIWPHGRWRHRFDGEGNHAGTTRLQDRRDPMLAFAELILDARRTATEFESLLTVGKAVIGPNGSNAIPMSVDAWVDARGPKEDVVQAAVAKLAERSQALAAEQGISVEVRQESWSPIVEFDQTLRDQVVDAVAAVVDGEVSLGGVAGPPPVLGTGAGHDAGVLAAHVPTAMLFVRNNTGISHSPHEHAEDDDCAVGVRALSGALEALLSQ